MHRILREPLIHFLVLGALIFAAFSWLNRDRQSAEEIHISRSQQEHLLSIFTRTWQRPPTAQEFQGLLQDYIRDEIAYREGIALGFDQEDTIIRRRMRQKLELLSDEIVSFTQPTDAQLQQYLEANIEAFRLAPRFDIRQVYISRDRRGAQAEAYALGLLDRLRNDPDADWSSLSDPLALPAALTGASSGELERYFGKRFTDSLLTIKTGVWTGPVESGYGLHLVIIDRFTPAMDPQLIDVRERVKTEWLAQRRLAATDEMYENLAEKYSIEIEPLPKDSVPEDSTEDSVPEDSTEDSAE